MQQINVFFMAFIFNVAWMVGFVLGFDMGFVSYLSLNKSAVGIFPKSC